MFENYDGFDCRDELAADFAAQAKRNQARQSYELKSIFIALVLIVHFINF